MNLCVIPARGGSKRIPQKNIRPFCGRPIIHYSIDAALEAQVFDRVVVSTDDDDIARVAEAGGADVPFLRPSVLADDHTGTNAVVAHAVSQLAAKGNKFKYAACVYATAPMLEAATIRSGLEILIRTGADFAVTVTTFPYPIQRALLQTPKGRIRMIQTEHLDSRSQELQEAFHDVGQLYWGVSKAFLSEKKMFVDNTTAPIRVDRHRAQDIDTPEDWSRAEALYRGLESGASS